MPRYIIFLLLFFSISFYQCDKKDSVTFSDINYNQLNKGIVYYNNELIRKELDKITIDLSPEVTVTDQFGHAKNFDLLIQRLNNCPNIVAEKFCYACIETYPLQSEILVTADSVGVAVQRIIDIVTPDNDILRYTNIHGTY